MDIWDKVSGAYEKNVPWEDINIKLFLEKLRRERYNQRIKFICLPQLGDNNMKNNQIQISTNNDLHNFRYKKTHGGIRYLEYMRYSSDKQLGGTK